MLLHVKFINRCLSGKNKKRAASTSTSLEATPRKGTKMAISSSEPDLTSSIASANSSVASTPRKGVSPRHSSSASYLMYPGDSPSRRVRTNDLFSFMVCWCTFVVRLRFILQPHRRRSQQCRSSIKMAALKVTFLPRQRSLVGKRFGFELKAVCCLYTKKER